MSTSPRVGLWAILPINLRVALVIASLVSVASGSLLFRTDVASNVTSDSAGDGDVAAPNLASEGLNDPTPSPTPATLTTDSRSEATITVPGETTDDGDRRERRFPTFANYVFDVQGTEQGPALSRRTLPPEMTMTVHRDQPLDGGGPAPEDDQLVFDLAYSPEHTEREVVTYGPQGMAFAYESIDVTFAGSSHSSEASFDPQLLQIPAALDQGTQVDGSSTAVAPNGTTQRVEDWSVEVVGTEQITVRGEPVEAWKVTVARQSRPGAAQQFSRTRTYWFDPGVGIWVRWEETTRMSEGSGLGQVSYSSDLTATLDRIEPL